VIKVIREYKSCLLLASILFASCIVSGCATHTTSLKYTQSELKLVPPIAIEKVLSSDATNVTVRVRASSIDGSAVVKGFEGQKYVLVADDQGQDIRLATSEITEVERIRKIKKPASSSAKSEASTAETVGIFLIYAPLIPVAIASWPALSAMGLDAHKNAEDAQKAKFVYRGMSKEDLNEYIGEPEEKYYCEAHGGREAEEVWVFGKDKVLRGGRTLFINLKSGTVSHNACPTSFFKDYCSPMTH